MTRLPFVGTMYIEVEFFPTAKNIPFRQSQYQLRSHQTIRLTRHVTFDIKIIRLIQNSIELHIKCVARKRRITRRKTEVHHTEQSRTAQPAHRLQIIVITVQLTGTQPQSAQQHTCTDTRTTTIKMKCKPATHNRIIQTLHKLTTQIHINLSNIPLAQSSIRHTVSHLQLQLNLTRHRQRVCQIRSIARLIIIVTIVPEKSTQTRTLFIENRHIERISTM